MKIASKVTVCERLEEKDEGAIFNTQKNLERMETVKLRFVVCQEFLSSSVPFDTKILI